MLLFRLVGSKCNDLSLKFVPFGSPQLVISDAAMDIASSSGLGCVTDSLSISLLFGASSELAGIFLLPVLISRKFLPRQADPFNQLGIGLSK